MTFGLHWSTFLNYFLVFVGKLNHGKNINLETVYHKDVTVHYLKRIIKGWNKADI